MDVSLNKRTNTQLPLLQSIISDDEVNEQCILRAQVISWAVDWTHTGSSCDTKMGHKCYTALPWRNVLYNANCGRPQEGVSHMRTKWRRRGLGKQEFLRTSFMDDPLQH